MRATITKIDDPKCSRNGDTSFRRVYFKLENGDWATTDLCPSYRNFARWREYLYSGIALDGLRLKSRRRVDADSFPEPIVPKVTGKWLEMPNGSRRLIRGRIEKIKEIGECKLKQSKLF